MKKIVIFLGIIIVLFAAIAIITNVQKEDKSEGNPYGKKNLQSATVDQLDDPNYQNLILPEELEQKLGDKEDVTVYFYSPTCPHCRNTTPIVAPLAEKMGIDLVQYNVLEFDKGWNDYQIESTPTIVHYKKGKEQDRIVGSNKESVFRNWFETNDIN
ncbi:thioredoxin [Peribacillus cavernae]|uniref:Thioredoxin n=1 Tax=Peribacillus cavernae TaxID=1674310 RepID=A0A3S0TXV0_9BACI|nr:thioredoxin family protein [Peribacillus cavernae]MDQ0219903.1 thioredoxin-like negative regulator of GroEL [Peribacillus cavernae]RUQ26614.1 thioredoxin [Peribacillus cavernae]